MNFDGPIFHFFTSEMEVNFEVFNFILKNKIFWNFDKTLVVRPNGSSLVISKTKLKNEPYESKLPRK